MKLGTFAPIKKNIGPHVSLFDDVGWDARMLVQGYIWEEQEGIDVYSRKIELKERITNTTEFVP